MTYEVLEGFLYANNMNKDQKRKNAAKCLVVWKSTNFHLPIIWGEEKFGVKGQSGWGNGSELETKRVHTIIFSKNCVWKTSTTSTFEVGAIFFKIIYQKNACFFFIFW